MVSNQVPNPRKASDLRTQYADPGVEPIAIKSDPVINLVRLGSIFVPRPVPRPDPIVTIVRRGSRGRPFCRRHDSREIGKPRSIRAQSRGHSVYVVNVAAKQLVEIIEVVIRPNFRIRTGIFSRKKATSVAVDDVTPKFRSLPRWILSPADPDAYASLMFT